MRRILLCCTTLLVSSLLFSCKKDKASKTTSTAISGYLGSRHNVIDSTFYLGATDVQEASAIFFATPGTFVTTIVDSVVVNNYPMEVDGDSIGHVGFSGSSIPLDMSSTCNWHVVGNASIPSFDFNYPVSYPAFTGSIPDTIYKSQGITFSLSFFDADSVYIEIAPAPNGYISKSFPANSAVQQFSPTELATVLPTAMIRGMVTVHAYRFTTQTFGGQNFQFIKEYSFTHCPSIQP